MISLHNPETNRGLRITDTGDVDSPAVGPWNDRWVWERFEAYDLGGGITGLYSPSTHWWLDTTNDGDVRALRLSDWNGWERFKVKVVAGECPAGSFLDNTKCTSVGEDCCAPNGEAATCQGGFFPIKTGVGCFGFREGAYVCCSEPEGICRSTADCRSQPDCVGQMVVCHEGTCYKGNQDAGCDGVTNGERYAGQQEGHWCWDGRSDTTCATASAPESPTFQLVLAGNPLSHECSACPDSNQDCKCSFEKASTRDADGNYLCGGYPGCWKVSSYAPAAEEMAASGRSAQQQCESYGDIWCGAGAGQMLGLSFGDIWQWDHQVLEHALLFPANYPKQDCFTSMFLAISIQIIR